MIVPCSEFLNFNYTQAFTGLLPDCGRELKRKNSNGKRFIFYTIHVINLLALVQRGF